MMTKRGWTWVLVLIGHGAVACERPEADEPWSSASSPIIGGDSTGICDWPTTVMIPDSLCSGTLVHPRVVMTAKHCLRRPPSTVAFGESANKISRTVPIAKCYAHPDSDFGFCVLDETVTDIPIVPVLAPCEMFKNLKPGASVVEAGFGTQSAGPNAASGTRKWIAGTVVQGGPRDKYVTVTSGTQDGEYFGDSGGPLFLRMPDGTWRVAGNDYASPDWNTTGKPRLSTYTSVAYHVAWAEQQSGIDITPCHDRRGWNPGPECVGSPVNPDPGVNLQGGNRSCVDQTMVRQPTCAGEGSDAGIQTQSSAAGPDQTTTVGGGEQEGAAGLTEQPGAVAAGLKQGNDGGANEQAGEFAGCSVDPLRPAGSRWMSLTALLGCAWLLRRRANQRLGR